MESDAIMEDVAAMLESLGVNRRYLGYDLALDAICRAIAEEGRRAGACRGMLRRLAQQHQCSPAQVERNLRTVVHRAWMVNADRLLSMAAYPLEQPPTVSEFVEILTVFVLRQRRPSARAERSGDGFPWASDVISEGNGAAASHAGESGRAGGAWAERSGSSLS